MDTPPPDEIREMRDELHRLIERLPDAALVALWQFVWTWLSSRPPRGSASGS
jgi:uracil-DNA glycosylase